MTKRTVRLADGLFAAPANPITFARTGPWVPLSDGYDFPSPGPAPTEDNPYGLQVVALAYGKNPLQDYLGKVVRAVSASAKVIVGFRPVSGTEGATTTEAQIAYNVPLALDYAYFPHTPRLVAAGLNVTLTPPGTGWLLLGHPRAANVVPFGTKNGVEHTKISQRTDTTVPICKITAANADKDSGDFAGAYMFAIGSPGDSASTFADVMPYFNVYYVIDDPPLTDVTGGSVVAAGTEASWKLRVRFFYPGGENIAGMQVSAGCPSLVAMMAPEGRNNFAHYTVAQTDGDGVATFKVFGATPGTGSIVIGIPDAGVAECFASIPLNYPVDVRPNTGAENCVLVLAVEEVTAVPARIEVTPVFGWEAGANSVDMLDGDVRVASDMDMVIGAIWGFTQDREGNPAKERITHGFYFSQSNNQPRYQVMESGRALTQPAAYAALSDLFEVRRIGSAVTYLVNNVRVFSSRAPLVGELSVGSALYASGDGVP